jgi:signal transduction histidine kinase
MTKGNGPQEETSSPERTSSSGGPLPAASRDEKRARSFRSAILWVILSCSLLGVGLSLCNYWNHSRLTRIEKSGRANVEFVKRCQRRVFRSSGVALNALDIVLLPGMDSISSYHLDPVLANAQFLHTELKESIAGRGLVATIEVVAPKSQALNTLASKHLEYLEKVDHLVGEVVAFTRKAVAGTSAIDADSARSLADRLVVAIEGSDDSAAQLSAELGDWMASRKSRQAYLAILTSVLYVLLVAYLLLWSSRAIALPIERMERALGKSVSQASSDLEFSSFREINSLRDTLIHLFTLRDAREEDLKIEVQTKVEALLRREQEIQHLQRIEHLGQLAGTVAHDFRNLLTVISGYGELIAMERDVSDSVRESVGELLGATHRATDLTEKLLAFSKREAGGASPGPMRVNEWFEECGVLLSPFGGQTTHKVELKCAPDLPDLALSRVSIDQVLMNLVSNARESLGGGKGLVRVSLNEYDEEALGPPPPALAGTASIVVLQVSDNGCGISEESQPRVFERYFSTKGGTGFGLSTVLEIVESAGGVVSFQSTEGTGTTFTVLLPGIRPEADTA